MRGSVLFGNILTTARTEVTLDPLLSAVVTRILLPPVIIEEALQAERVARSVLVVWTHLALGAETQRTDGIAEVFTLSEVPRRLHASWLWKAPHKNAEDHEDASQGKHHALDDERKHVIPF